LGFFKGGHLVAAISTHFDQRFIRLSIRADKSCRPDFAMACLSGHLWIEEKRNSS